MLAVTLLVDRDLGLGAPGVPARGRRFVTDRYGPTATNGAISAVIWSPNLGVLAVAAAGVLCAFSCVVDALPGQCLRRRSGANPLVAAVFRTKWLLREHCSATCQRRRCAGQDGIDRDDSR